MNEYGFTQLLLKRKREILETYQADMEYYKDYCGFTLLPKDVLVLVLTRVNRKDIYALLQVCKAWKEVVLTVPTFWKRFVKEKVLEKTSNQKMAEVVGSFDHLFKVQFDIRQKYEWLFKQTWCRFEGKSFYRGTYNFYTVQYVLEVDALHIILFKTGNDRTYFTKAHGYQETIYLSNVFDITDHMITHIYFQYSSKKYHPVDKEEPCIFLWTCQHGTYSGQARYEPDTILVQPHGDGRWVLKDGRVIEGEGVAWKGEPRMKV